MLATTAAGQAALVWPRTCWHPAREVEIAKIVSHASLRDSFFALSACYGPDEIGRFAETLAADSGEPMTQDELNQFIVSQLARLEDDRENGNDPTIGEGQGQGQLPSPAPRPASRGARVSPAASGAVEPSFGNPRVAPTGSAPLVLSADAIGCQQYNFC